MFLILISTPPGCCGNIIDWCQQLKSFVFTACGAQELQVKAIVDSLPASVNLLSHGYYLLLVSTHAAEAERCIALLLGTLVDSGWQEFYAQICSLRTYKKYHFGGWGGDRLNTWISEEHKIQTIICIFLLKRPERWPQPFTMSS